MEETTDDPTPDDGDIASEPSDSWGARLDVVAVAAAGALLVLFFASALYALTVDVGTGGDMIRYQRLQITTQVGSISYGGLLLIAALAVCVRRWLRDDEWLPDARTTTIELVVAATAVLVTLSALAATLNELVWIPDGYPGGFQWFRIAEHLGAATLGASAIWLVVPEAQRRR